MEVEGEMKGEARGAPAESMDIDTWVQCDSCSKWRRVPAAAFPLPARWLCQMNPAPCTATGGGPWSCAVPEDLEEEEDHEAVAADGEYLVERLLAKRTRDSKVEYLVRWAGFTKAADSWEPAANINKAMIESFERPSARGQTTSPPPRVAQPSCPGGAVLDGSGKGIPRAPLAAAATTAHATAAHAATGRKRPAPPAPPPPSANAAATPPVAIPVASSKQPAPSPPSPSAVDPRTADKPLSAYLGHNRPQQDGPRIKPFCTPETPLNHCSGGGHHTQRKLDPEAATDR